MAEEAAKTEPTNAASSVPTLAQIRAKTRDALKQTQSIAVDGVTTVSGLPDGVQPYVVPVDCTAEKKKRVHEKMMARGWSVWEGPVLTSLPARPTVYVIAREDYEVQRDARGRRLAQAARGR